jgi:heme exporter protein B
MKIAFRKPSTILNPLLFFIIAISLFPLAISPEAKVLSQIASGLIWVVVLLAVL